MLISAIAYNTGILIKTKWQRIIDMSEGLEMHNSTKLYIFYNNANASLMHRKFKVFFLFSIKWGFLYITETLNIAHLLTLPLFKFEIECRQVKKE